MYPTTAVRLGIYMMHTVLARIDSLHSCVYTGLLDELLGVKSFAVQGTDNHIDPLQVPSYL